MSFRARLSLFFVLIVIVPMLSVAVVLFRLISDNETGKSDARIAATEQTAISLYRDARRQADRGVRVVGTDTRLAAALRSGNRKAARRRAARLVGSRHLVRIVIAGDAKVTVDVGSRDAIAPAVRELVGARGGSFGRLEASVQRAAGYAADVRRVAGVPVVVSSGGRVLVSTVPDARAPDARLPAPGEPGDVTIAGHDYRAASFDALGFHGTAIRVTVLASDEGREAAIKHSFLLAAGILLGFLVLALTFAVIVSRSLQSQIGSFLAAARRLASGDFSGRVPTVGRDEFAELGQEFNKMSRQLETRMEELRQERARLQASLRRIGQTFESNLDRDALLEIVVRTAVDGVEAAGGRVSARTGPGRPLEERARLGDLAPLEEALRQAEDGALSGESGSEASVGGVHAIAQPLAGSESDGQLLGVLSVARTDRPFADRERDVLAYLAGTAGVSIENVGLHEAVQRQAVTDELTGLFNHRRFQEALVSEAERARRFGHGVALVMLDLDEFKQVNDSYGHQQGDVVLAAVARVLRASSREIDAPARYGGEELAVVLPETDLDGAYRLAERVRQGIEALEFPMPDGGMLRVTASLGVAAMPETAGAPRELLAAADAALYEAKRGGRNKTVRAGARV